MTLNFSCKAAMTTRSCTDKVHCLRVTIRSDITQIQTYKLARWIYYSDRNYQTFTDYHHPCVLY